MLQPNPRIPYSMTTERPRLKPLNSKPLMVHVVLNVEYWPFEQAMPRAVIPPPHGAEIIPVCVSVCREFFVCSQSAILGQALL